MSAGGSGGRAAATQLVILPGTDGTGLLLDALRDALGDTDHRVIAYPAERALDHAALAAWIAPQLPNDRPYVLLGESFAGPLAILLAARAHACCRGLVLCATYARYPLMALRALAPLARAAPLHQVPLAVAAWWLLGRWSTPHWRARLRRALDAVPPAVLRARLHAALAVDARDALRQVRMPILCLQASHDRIVPAAALRELRAVAPLAQAKTITGPHFLLQAAAPACAAAVRDWLAALPAAAD